MIILATATSYIQYTNTDILIYQAVCVNTLANNITYLHIQQTQNYISIRLEYFWLPDEQTCCSWKWKQICEVENQNDELKDTKRLCGAQWIRHYK